MIIEPMAVLDGILFNVTWCLAMYSTQELEVMEGLIQRRGTKVPGTNQMFLHWQDFYCQRYGNTIGLSLLVVGFVHIALYGSVMSVAQWVVFGAICCIDATGFTLMCLGKKHKPDWGYPQIGRVSFPGAIHSVYHGISIAMAAFCAWHWLIMKTLTGPVLWLTIAGGAIYLLAFAMDIRAGHFDRIRRLF